jgi:hypothetical protein
MGSTVLFAAPIANAAGCNSNSITMSAIGAQTAGTPFSIILTVKQGGATATCFTGTATLTTNAGGISPGTVGPFVSGVWNGSVTITFAGAGRTITATDSQAPADTVTSGAFAVNAAALDHFNVSVSPSASVTADGAATVSAAARDLYNNARSDNATFNVTAGSGAIGLTTGVFTPSLVGTATIQARNGTVTNTTTISVSVGALDHVSFTSAPSTTPADTPATFVASAFDAKGNARNDPIAYASSNATVGTISAAGLFTPNLVGSSAISATSGAKSANATITVTPGGLDHVTFITALTATDADTPVTFTAQARDVHNNARADAIAYGIGSGSGSIGASTGVFTPNLVGTTNVPATSGGKSATASIAVSVGALDHVTFLSAPTTTDADTSVSFLARPYDRHDNLRSDAIAYAVTSGSGSVGATSGLYAPTLVGTTNVSATAGARSASASILVTIGALHHLAWSASPTTTDADTAVTFTAQAFDAHGNLRSDPIAYGIASGSGGIGASSGLFAPSAAGATTIRAAAGALNVTASILVTPGPLDHVTFTSAPASTDADTPVTFTAQPRDDKENARSDGIAYSLASGGGAVDPASGLYTPSTAGSVTVRATAGAKHADATIAVSPGPLHHVSFTSAPTSTDADHAATFHAVAYDDKGNARPDAVAYGLGSGSGSVDATSGLYTPHLVGSATIRATAGARNATVTIAVTAGSLAQILVSPATATLEAGAAQGFTAAGYDAEGNAASIAPAWSASCGSIGAATGAYTAPTTLGPCDVHATSGTVSGSASLTIIDDLPPTASASASCALPGSDGWCRSDVTVGTSASDAQTGLAPGSPTCALHGSPVACGSILVTTPGAHTLDVLATDRAGNAANASATFHIDAAPPSLSIDLACAAQGGGWCRGASYPYNVTSSDATSGLASVLCTLDGASAPCAGTIRGEGPHTLDATARDVAGNEATTSASLGIDSVAPSLGVSLTCAHEGNAGWCLDASYHYEVSSSDATSGLAALACRLDGADAACSGTVTGEGPHMVSATASDHAGNGADANASLAIDSVAPAPAILVTCDVTGTAGWCVSPSYDANASATDATSGIASLTCTLDGAPSACGASVTGEGPHAFAATATDAAGHDASTHVSLAIDSVAPDVALTPACTHEGNPGWCLGASYSYAGSASDGTSGIASLLCRVDGASAPCSGTVGGEGPHHVELHATDAAGLASSASFDLAIDSVAPSVGIAPACATPGNAGWCRSGSYAYAGSAADGTSGLADGAPTCALDGVPAPCGGIVGGEGAHTLGLDASDAAGNAAHADLALAIDSVAPDAGILADCAHPGHDGWCLDGSYGYAGGASDETSGLALVACAVDLAPAPCSGTIAGEGPHHASVVAFDAAGNGAGASFDLAIDSVAPGLATPSNLTLEAEDATGATGAYDVPAASDDTSGAGPVLCAPASGSRFALGHTTVTCGADDAAGHHAEVSFDVLVQDTTAPVLAPHDDITAEATSASGATAPFDAPATSDAVDGAGVSLCDPASGSTFALGDTTVTCSAADAAGNAGVPSTFSVHVLDTTAPLVAPHLDVAAEATGADGATVAFDAPATSDAVDGAGTATCDPASGSLFALGSTDVSCGATDAAGNVALPATFHVAVHDTTAPAIDAHDDVTAEATGAEGATVTYDTPSTSDAVDGAGIATCAPASGALFALGHTTVACSARDAAGNHASKLVRRPGPRLDLAGHRAP